MKEPAGENAPGADGARARIAAWLRAPAPPSLTAAWWDAGGHRLSLFFWLAMALQVGSLFRQRLLPFIDYPQHLMLGAILSRMLRAGAPERLLYETNVAGFNSMFHVLVAYLALMLPIERAGEAAMGIVFLLTATATLQLLKATGRPRARAFLIIPLLSTFPVLWGLCNFMLSLAIQLFVVARVIAAPRVAPERRLRFDALTAALALLGMWAHLLASLIAYALMLAAIVADAMSLEASFVRRILRALRAGLPLLPALGYLRWAYYAQPGMSDYKFLDDEVGDHTGYEKITLFFDKVNWMREDARDHRILVAGVAALALSGILGRGRVWAPPAARWLLPAAVALYLMLPLQMWGATWGVYPRLGIVVVLMFMLAVPQSPRPGRFFPAVYCLVGLAAAGTFFQTMGFGKKEIDAFERIVEDAPPGRRIAGIVFDQQVEGYWARITTHFPAYYVARKGGEAAVSFAAVPSLPVHYKEKAKPPDPPDAFEFNPYDYDPSTPFASYFDLLIVRTEGETDEDPRATLFKDDPGKAGRVRAHHGRWWLIEAKKGR